MRRKIKTTKNKNNNNKKIERVIVMKEKEIEFIKNLGNERIRQKFALIENNIFFEYAIKYGYYTTNDNKKELEILDQLIKKDTEYLINCGYKLDDLEKYKKQVLDRVQKHFEK